MGLLETFTGGKSDSAMDALRRAEQYFTSVKTPTAEQLTLPELEQYVEMGILTPAQAQAYMQNSNAYNGMNVDQTGTDAQVQALNNLSQVANAGPEGTPMQQAQMANTISQMNTSVGGQRGAIEQSMAAKGTPQALIQAALSNQSAGQDAQNAYLAAVNGQGQTYQAALNAMSQMGGIGNAMQGQQNQQANTVAAAQNAMQQFNAANQQNASEANANRSQEAGTMNLANRQQVSNNNVGVKNTRTQYNAGVPQQVFNNEMAKAQGMAGAASNIGDMYQKQGQQQAGITSGLINTGMSFIPQPKTGAPVQAKAHGGMVEDPYCMGDGGIVPGEASVSGDSFMNDTVPVQASPGEAVIPRSSVAENPELVSSLMGEADSGSQIDFQDVATILKAMRSIRMGVA